MAKQFLAAAQLMTIPKDSAYWQLPKPETATTQATTENKPAAFLELLKKYWYVAAGGLLLVVLMVVVGKRKKEVPAKRTQYEQAKGIRQIGVRLATYHSK